MIVDQYYINEDTERAQSETGLSLDEIEALVGRYRPHSCRAGKLRGEVVIRVDGALQIRHSFKKTLIWSNQ